MSGDMQQEKQVTVSPVRVSELPRNPPAGKTTKSSAFLKDIPVTISVELGRIQMNIEEVLFLSIGSTIMLKRQVNEPIDLLVNGKLIGHGEVVAVDENFGIRITDIIEPGRE
jgi:flagellar motor switch protein FliN/FliY